METGWLSQRVRLFIGTGQTVQSVGICGGRWKAGNYMHERWSEQTRLLQIVMLPECLGFIGREAEGEPGSAPHVTCNSILRLMDVPEERESSLTDNNPIEA